MRIETFCCEETKPKKNESDSEREEEKKSL